MLLCAYDHTDCDNLPRNLRDLHLPSADDPSLSAWGACLPSGWVHCRQVLSAPNDIASGHNISRDVRDLHMPCTTDFPTAG